MENIKINKNRITYPSFIVLNRQFDKTIFKDSKLLSLLIFIGLRVARNETDITYSLNNIRLAPGQFIIGRLSTVAETDLTEQEYRTRFEKLVNMKIIAKVKSTNKFTIGQWLINSFIDLNIQQGIPPSTNQQSNQQTSTNNNSVSFFITSYLFTNEQYTDKEYILVLKAYMQHKGIELRGEEMKDALRIIEKIFKSRRTPQEAISFMQWLQSNVDNEELIWTKFWTISTVQKKLPEFLADKLRVPTIAEEYKDA